MSWWHLHVRGRLWVMRRLVQSSRQKITLSETHGMDIGRYWGMIKKSKSHLSNKWSSSGPNIILWQRCIWLTLEIGPRKMCLLLPGIRWSHSFESPLLGDCALPPSHVLYHEVGTRSPITKPLTFLTSVWLVTSKLSNKVANWITTCEMHHLPSKMNI